jgi:hypothetical protein
MRNRFCAVTLSFCALILPAARAHAQVLPAEDHVVELGVMFWKPSPELTLSTDALSGAGVDNVDFVQEFGIEDKWFPEFRAVIGRNHKLRLSYVSINYDADATLQRTFTFNNQEFAVGAPASTDIKWNLWKVGYEWDFVSRLRGFVGFIADVKYNNVEASVESPLLASAAAVDTTAAVPTFGGIGRVNVSRMVAVTGEFTGLSINRDEFEAKFLDVDVYGTVSFGRNVGVQGGYRSVVVDYLVDGDSGDLKMKGPYFGAVVRF